VEVGLDRAVAQPHGGGDVGDGEVVEVVERDDRALLEGEAADGVEQRLATPARWVVRRGARPPAGHACRDGARRAPG
jgi:hypothetical protein